jgi:hypothetical protein
VCLESFRIDASSRVWVFLVPSAIAIFMGSLGVCTAFVTHGVFSHTDWFAIVGAASMLAGLGLAVFVVGPVITHDEYVAALEGGLLWKLAGEEGFIAWDEIAAVKWDAKLAAIVIARREGEPMAIAREFGRMKAELVAPLLDEMRRKAEFHLL